MDIVDEDFGYAITAFGAAMMFSTPFLSATETGHGIYTVIGKGGQISSNLLTGVVLVQTSRKARRRGDPKTTCRHRRHTCVSGLHLHVELESGRVCKASCL